MTCVMYAMLSKMRNSAATGMMKVFVNSDDTTSAGLGDEGPKVL